MCNSGLNKLGSSRLEAAMPWPVLLAPPKSLEPQYGQNPLVVAAHVARRGIVARRSFRDFECLCRDVDDGSKRTTGAALAIAAMTVEHHDRFGADFVANGATEASTGK
jgi:hypothetical protein